MIKVNIPTCVMWKISVSARLLIISCDYLTADKQLIKEHNAEKYPDLSKKKHPASKTSEKSMKIPKTIS